MPPDGRAGPRMTALVLCTGMAGSGKTSLMQRINSHLHMQRSPSYIINLDPAVTSTPYDPNIDIRDTVSDCAQRSSRALCVGNCAMTQTGYLPPQHCFSASLHGNPSTGEVQGGHETVQSGAQWRHPHLAELVRHTIRSGASAVDSAQNEARLQASDLTAV